MSNKVLTKLPKSKYGKKFRVDWNKSIGMEIEIYHYEKIYKLKIINKINDYVYVKYLTNEIFKIDSTRLLKGSIGNIVGTKTSKYKYNVGDIVETKTGDIKIIEIIRKNNNNGDGYTTKGYEYQCMKDGYIGKIDEIDLINKKGCPVCSNKVIIKGINDVATTHPDKIKYFYDKEDVYKYSYGSEQLIKTICPHCGDIRTDLSVKRLCKYNYNCRVCGDGIPFTERLMYSVLNEITNKNDIICQYSPKWNNLGQKKYDFYLESMNCIIETHGRQHYESNCFERLSHRTLADEQNNDKLKEQLARDNGINSYIVIDCRESNLEWIKNAILHSELKDLFDLSKVDWSKCLKNSMKNITKEICNSWNNGNSIKEIKETYKISIPKINNSLKLGRSLGWCNYDEQESFYRSLRKKQENYKNPVVGINIKTFEVIHLNKINDGKLYNMTPSSISMAINNKLLYCYGYVWVRLDEYIDTLEYRQNIVNTKLSKIIKHYQKYKYIKGTNILNGNILKFNSSKDAEKEGFLLSGISSCCNGRIQSYKQYTWEYVS